MNGAVYGDCKLECEFDSGPGGARQRLAHAAESGCFATTGTEGSRVSAELFQELGYTSVAVTQKSYNGVAILSRSPITVVSTALVGAEADGHARFLEAVIRDIHVANVYLPNGNPPGSDKFSYKLAWMDRLQRQMQIWAESEKPTLVGGDFNVIPEDIDCHKPSSWMYDALFQPEPRARYRAYLGIGYIDAFRYLHPGEGSYFTFWDYFRKAFEYNRGIRIDHFLLSPKLAPRLESCEIDKGRKRWRSRRTTPRFWFSCGIVHEMARWSVFLHSAAKDFAVGGQLLSDRVPAMGRLLKQLFG